MPATKLDNLGSIPGPTWLEGENRLPSIYRLSSVWTVMVLRGTRARAHKHTLTHTHRVNFLKPKNLIMESTCLIPSFKTLHEENSHIDVLSD